MRRGRRTRRAMRMIRAKVAEEAADGEGVESTSRHRASASLDRASAAEGECDANELPDSTSLPCA
eukprot:8923449-Pyramimonas_sp.AAC.1